MPPFSYLGSLGNHHLFLFRILSAFKCSIKCLHNEILCRVLIFFFVAVFACYRVTYQVGLIRREVSARQISKVEVDCKT